MERFFRIDDRVLKYMTVLLEADVDIESIKEEIDRKETKDDLSMQDDDLPVQKDDNNADQNRSDTLEPEAIEEGEATETENSEEEL